jgi:quercetin dioxygenase-like cupin family protein
MPRIEFIHADDGDFVRVADKVAQDPSLTDAARRLTSSELEGTAVRLLFGSPTDLEAFEVRYDPGTTIAPHAHVEDEIIYILEGSMEIGNRTYPPGSALAVPAWTLYGFRAGAEGLRFVNFRATKSDRPHVSRDEFLAERRP